MHSPRHRTLIVQREGHGFVPRNVDEIDNARKRGVLDGDTIARTKVFAKNTLDSVQPAAQNRRGTRGYAVCLELAGCKRHEGSPIGPDAVSARFRLDRAKSRLERRQESLIWVTCREVSGAGRYRQSGNRRWYGLSGGRTGSLATLSGHQSSRAQ